jgi:hypothetical protein
MRIGECADLSSDCLRSAGPGQWAVHVPLGKLKTERMVPVDSFVCELVKRLRFFRSLDSLPADGRLLARPRTPKQRSLITFVITWAFPHASSPALNSRCFVASRFPLLRPTESQSPFQGNLSEGSVLFIEFLLFYHSGRQERKRDFRMLFRLSNLPILDVGNPEIRILPLLTSGWPPTTRNPEMPR